MRAALQLLTVVPVPASSSAPGRGAWAFPLVGAMLGLTAAAALPLPAGALVALVWLDHTTTPGAWLLPLALVVGLAGANEVVTLLARGGYRPLPAVIYGGTLLVIASNAIPMFLQTAPDDQPLDRLGWPLVAFALALLAALVGALAKAPRPVRDRGLSQHEQRLIRYFDKDSPLGVEVAYQPA